MNNGNGKGVSLIKYTPESKNEKDIIVTRSFVADDIDIKDSHWRSLRLSDFLYVFHKELREIKGDKESMDYPHEILDPIVETYTSYDSLYPQSVVTFSAKIKGRKELN